MLRGILRYLGGSQTLHKPDRIPLICINLDIAAAVARTVTYSQIKSFLVQYIGLEMAFLILCTSTWLFTHPPRWLLHLYFIIQCIITILLVRIYPQFDFVILLFIVLSIQASYFFSGRVRLAWAAVLVLLTWGSMMYFLGFENSLVKTPTVIAAEIVVLAYVLVTEEIDTARARSQALLNDLGEVHRKLEAYTKQVEELVAERERDRVSRTLHDTVSQLLFSISLTARAAELLLHQDSGRVSLEIEHLKMMTTEALSQLRSLIAQLRVSDDKSQ
jgi:signal transduction histidine kinase